MNALLMLLSSASEMGPEAIPGWGWVTIVSVLASTVAALGGLYKKARDKEVEAVASKVVLAQKVGDKTSELLERAIEAFTLNKTGNDQLVSKLNELAGEIRELRQEVRRAGEASK